MNGALNACCNQEWREDLLCKLMTLGNENIIFCMFMSSGYF